MNSRTSAGFELRVLQGEQQGAFTAVPAETAILVGSGLDSDVVLRGAGQGDVRLSVKAAADGVHLAVQQGEVRVQERTLAAGQSAVVPLGTPLTLGQTQIALLQAQAAAAAESIPCVAADSAEAPGVPPPAAPDPFMRWPRRLLTGGAALAAVSVAVLAFAYSALPTPPTPAQQAQRAEAVLHGAAMPGLTVRADAQGALRISGYLETAAQRARAEQLLAAEQLPREPAAAQLDWQVWVNQSVAAAVQDVFRANGIQADVEAVGPGAVRVRTRVADPLVLDPVRSIARRDVAGLAALEVQNSAPAAQGQPVVVDDPGKRVASIVPGEPPYIVTVDGTRYFEGALLPSGHRIAGIEERQVLLEFNGVRTPLIF